MMRRAALVGTFLILLTSVGLSEAQMHGRGDGPRAGAREGRGLPTVDEMADAVSANPEQRAVLAEARLAWVQAQRERGARGPGWAHDEDEMPGGPPVMVFLAEVAPALDTGEMIALVDLLEEKMPAGGRGPMRDGDGPHGHGGPGGHAERDPLPAELDLTESQREQVDALHATTRGALRALAGQVGPGEEPTQAQLDQASRLREHHQQQLASILTKEQMDELLRLRAERRAENAERAQARFERQKSQRLEQLTALLDLDGAQRSKVEQAIDAAHDEQVQAMAERMSEGGPMPNLFERGRGEGGPKFRASANEAIREVLRPQQRELFARLQTLAGPMGRGSRGPQGGHGPGAHGRGASRH